jgi:quinol monooxygenase YgiN
MESAMPVRLIVTFQLKPGTSKAYAKAFEPIGRETLKEPGCEQYELFESTSDPDKVVLIERWSDQAKLDTHMEVMRKRDMAPLAALRAGPPAMEKFVV